MKIAMGRLSLTRVRLNAGGYDSLAITTAGRNAR